MSHFTVLVVGPNPERQLAPYQENNMNTCPPELLSFVDQEDEFQKEYETGSVEMVELEDGTRVLPWDERFRVPGSIGTGSRSHVPPAHLKTVRVPHSDRFASVEEFAKEWHGSKGRDPKAGKFGYWENGDAKWDWYKLGGRWTGFFFLKEGRSGVVGAPGLLTDPAEPGWVDQALKGDIDFKEMRRAKEATAAKDWDAAQAEAPAARWIKYGIEKDDTREEYIRNCGRFSTFAVLMDGKWYERGSMGWWGCVSGEKAREEWAAEYERLVYGLPDDTLLSVYDCHI